MSMHPSAHTQFLFVGALALSYLIVVGHKNPFHPPGMQKVVLPFVNWAPPSRRAHDCERDLFRAHLAVGRNMASPALIRAMRGAPGALWHVGRGMSAGPTLSLPCVTLRTFCSNREVSGHVSKRTAQPKRSGEELRELRARGEVGVGCDPGLLPAETASVFPRIKTTSLSTKRIVIHDEAARASATLVLVAFRRYAEEQLSSWRSPFLAALEGEPVVPHRRRVGQVFDVTINESFGAQALSGFVQRLQRRTVDSHLHDYYVAFNDRAREPLEVLLPLDNRLYGYALLLDSKARVRFRAAGMADEHTLKPFVKATRSLVEEDVRM